MTKRLDGRIAVVTGGAAGIGRTIVQKLAEEGADVAVLDVNPAPETEVLVKASGRRFLSVVGSIAEEDSVNAFADRVHEELGDVDIVVNKAAIAMVPDFEDTSFDDWKNLFSVNVNGPFLITKAFLQDLKNSAHGRGRAIDVLQNLQAGLHVSTSPGCDRVPSRDSSTF
jgi:NAD(P)-dependent dehydrogenase (short-subunit alcohol dehydrogenase family)